MQTKEIELDKQDINNINTTISNLCDISKTLSGFELIIDLYSIASKDRKLAEYFTKQIMDHLFDQIQNVNSLVIHCLNVLTDIEENARKEKH